MKNICIIPARAGSKRIKNKNITSFFGKPLIFRAIYAAKKSNLFSEIFISTDSLKIINLAKKYNVSYLVREKYLSNGSVTIHSVIQKTIKHLKKKIMFDNVCCILPTAVLINYKNLIKSYKILSKNKSDFVIPVAQFSYPPQRGLKINKKKIYIINKKNYNINSQKFSKIYHDAGQFYWGKASSYLKYKNTFNGKSSSLILSNSEVQDIDDQEDIKLAKIKYQSLYK